MNITQYRSKNKEKYCKHQHLRKLETVMLLISLSKGEEMHLSSPQMKPTPNGLHKMANPGNTSLPLPACPSISSPTCHLYLRISIHSLNYLSNLHLFTIFSRSSYPNHFCPLLSTLLEQPSNWCVCF